MFHRRCEQQPERTAYVFLKDGESESARWTYRELHRRSLSIATQLVRRVQSGERVVLLLPHGPDYAAAFFGCLLAGAVAVPVHAAKREEGLRRLQAIVDNCQPALILTSAGLHTSASLLRPEVLVVDGALGQSSASEFLFRPEPEAIAFLQYTSGSTSDPKGVIVQHRQLMANQAAIREAFELTETSVIAGWLPFFHDMGLVGQLLQPLYAGVPGILFSPSAFLQRPVRWLQVISRYGATISGAPNFAYDLCARKMDMRDCQGLDLSRWRVAFNGSEPIRPATLSAFEDRFAPFGFQRTSWLPCYGLAESTLMVSGTLALDGPRHIQGNEATTFVACGAPVRGTTIKIVDPETKQETAPDGVGEIWVSGPSVAAGYWNSPGNDATFGQMFSDGNGYLRTGDLGFVDRGQLVVTGRLKDLIIVRGRNIYPQDIEFTTGDAHNLLKGQTAAAFAVDGSLADRDQTETLVVVVECPDLREAEQQSVLAAILRAIATEHEVEVAAVCLVNRGTIPKTTSGKVRRSACRDLYVSGSLDVIACWESRHEDSLDIVDTHDRTETITAEVARLIGIPKSDVSIHESLAKLGLSSLASAELSAALNERFGISIQLADLYSGITIAQLAGQTQAALRAESDRRTGTIEAVVRFPLSRNQQSLYSLQRLAPESTAYHISAAIELPAQTSIERVREVLSQLMAAHDMLRSTVVEIDGNLSNEIRPTSELPFDVLDVPALSAQTLGDELRRLTNLPFAQAGTLLWRTTYVRQQNRSVLLAVFHHIIADLRSLSAFYRELMAALRGDGESVIGDRGQYQAFVERQAAWRSSSEANQARDYWQTKLTGALPYLELPLQKARSAIRSGEGARCVRRLAPGLLQRVRNFGSAQNTTVFCVLLSSFEALLFRYTQQADFILGTPYLGRDSAANGSTFGYFVNPVVLRADLANDPSFVTLTARVHSDVAASLKWSRLPFADVVDIVQPERRQGRAVLCDAMFVHQETSDDEKDMAALALGIGAVEFDPAVTQRDLTLTSAVVEGELALMAEYDTHLFEPWFISGLLSHYERLLEQCLENPEERVSLANLLTSEERSCVVSAPRSAKRSDATLHARFAQTAASNSNRVAATFGCQQITYEDLDGRANRLARWLQQQGAMPEQLVAVYLERSLDLLVAILAALKSGAAYLPIDPANPADRISAILEDAKPCVVITQDSLARYLEGSPCTFRMDSDWALLQTVDDQAVDSLATADNLAYVIYTSGSTGRPKGCLISHRNAVRLFDSVQPIYGFHADDVWTMFHSAAFDFSVWEMWGAWLYGGRVIVVPQSVCRSPEEFSELLVRDGVSVLSQTPTAFRSLIDALGSDAQSRLPALRWIVFGGEALEFRTLRNWFASDGSSRARLVNMYGITETTVHVTLRHVTQKDALRQNASLIGSAIDDLQIYLLDGNLQLVPPGIPAEIYVGGEGLARGYLNRPALTADRFLPNPFSGNAGDRLYRTGDIARLAPLGDIEYLGRADRQVQLRGYRVELGEIEAALEALPDVRQAVVIPKVTQTSGATECDDAERLQILSFRRYLKHRSSALQTRTETTLLAYFLSEAPEHPDVDELRSHLTKLIPEYMIPAAFVRLARFPVTAGGKIDRNALSETDTIHTRSTGAFAAPSNASERLLAGIWADVLGLQQASVEDNFFAIGGDSIRAIQVVAKAASAGVRINIQDLYQHQTIRRLAAVVALMELPVDPLVSTGPFSLIDAGDRLRLPERVEDAYPLVRMQSGLLYHGHQHAHSSIYRATFLYRFEGELNREAFLKAARILTRRHTILRTSFDLVHYSEPLQLVWSDVEPAVAFEDLRRKTDPEQEQALDVWFELERDRDFDATKAPLARFTVHQLSENSFTVGLTCHDAILDGWSTSLLLVELLRAYDAEVSGENLLLSEGATLYRDFVHMELRDLESAQCQSYWDQTLAGCHAAPLPFLIEQSAAPPRLAVVDVTLPAALSDGLKRRSRELGRPLKHLLLAAHLRVIETLTGQSDVVTGLEMNGRVEQADGDLSVGQHLNTVPFRQKLSGGSWIDLIESVFASEQQMLPYRRFPYAEIQRRLGNIALYDTTFNYTHFHVFRELDKLRSLRVVSGHGRELTHYALKTEFNRDAFTDRVHLDLIFDAARLPESVARFAGEAYLRALTSIAEDPEARYETCSLIPDEIAQTMLARSSGPTIVRKRLTLTALCEQQRDRSPHALAVIHGTERLTYVQLHRKSNQLAHYLQTLGIGPGTYVGVQMERSANLVVALLAVLKTGAAYVPMDPGYPVQRLQAMADDARVALTLTDELVRSLDLQTYPDYDPARFEHQLSTAYVLFTSGSTGRPKGAANTHQGICNRLLWMQETYGLDNSDRVLQKTPISFDVSGWEFFWPLISGAAIVLARPGGHVDPVYLAELIRREAITTIHFVPSMLRVFLQEPTVESCRSLRRVICSGEELTPDLANRFRSIFDCELHNLYGPTEAAIDVTAWPCLRDSGAGPIPIGMPISNTQLLILDRHGNQCPDGVLGELHIGGLNLACGYIHQPGLTAERFIPNSYGEFGARLYRTGDLARVREDGAIEFLGRQDGQVKIRGVRIELSEVEISIRAQPGIRACAVAVEAEAQGRSQLVCYVVPDDTFEEQTVRDGIAATLPSYMIPSKFLMLAELPLTPSGKLDRKLLRQSTYTVAEDELAALLRQVEQLSDQEAKLMLQAGAEGSISR